MSDTLSISVVIPTVGRENLEAALASIVIQDYPPDEVVVVADICDDHGFDLLRDRIKNFECDFPLVLLRNSGSGVAAARNQGIQSANGTYIAFLDDDDVWLPNHLSAFFMSWSSHQHLGYFSAYRTAVRRQIIGAMDQKITFVRLALKMTRVGTSTAIIHKALLDEKQFPLLKRRSDIALWLALSKSWDLVFNPQVTCIYDDSTEASLSKGVWNKVFSLIRAVYVGFKI